nr:unnamed protein product [Callosobruchus chinensis]
MEKRSWTYKELENLTQNEIYNILEDIPSDNESNASDIESVMADNIDIDDIRGNETVCDIEGEILAQADDLIQWDSEDELPLSAFVSNEVFWTTDEGYVRIPQSFNENTGPNIPDDAETPVDIFLQLFPDDMIKNIVFQTNLYYIQAHGGDSVFTPTTEDEVKTFLGVNLLMGVKPLPSYRDYWSSNDQLRDSYVSAAISRARFTWLLANLHLADNSIQPRRNEPGYDKLYKVRPLLSKLSETFLTALNPHGRSSLKQYMPNKPIKRGYKVWVRADSSGYLCEFQIYTGKNGEAVEKCLGTRVVKDLTRSLVGKGHRVFFDNYFNSLKLQRSLIVDGIYASGTVRKGRKYYPALKADKEMNRGDIDFRISTDGLTALKWMDKRSVLFLANYQNPNVIERVPRKSKSGVVEEVTCPRMVKDYNCHMGYVDKFDMLKSLYEVDRKSHKWWHRIFFHFLDVCIVNAFILFQLRSKSKSLSMKDFRLSVIAGLIGAYASGKRGRPSSAYTANKFRKYVPTEVRTSKASHMPQRATSLRCANCRTKGIATRTLWKCSTCDVGLCIKHDKNCFAEFHS